MRLRDLPIRRKVTLSVLLVFGVVLTVATVGFTAVWTITFRDRAAVQLNALAELIAVGVNSAVLFDEPAEAVSILDRLRRESEIVEAHVVKADADGFHVFASSPRDAIPPDRRALTARGTYDAPGGMWLVRDLEDDKGNAFAVLAVRSDLAALREERQRALFVLVTSVVALLGMGVWLTRMLRRTITEPIALLAETAHQIAQHHDPSMPIRAPKLAQDEVGSLADDFNSMLDALADQAAVLHEKEERYRLLVENSSELVCELGADGSFIYANPNYLTVLGFESAELMGTPALAMVHSDEVTHIAFLLQQQEGRAVFRHRHKDGSWRWLESAGRRYRTSKGEERGVIISRDITERTLAEMEQEKLRAQLAQSQKMESIGRLAGGVAHDFNNMLSVILGHAEVASEHVRPGDPLHASLEQITHAAQRSAELTRQLLGFARIQTIAPRVLDLNETVDGMLKMLRRLIGEDVDLAWMPGRHVPGVKIDPSQVNQILANLCVNARDAITDVGKVTIETGTASFDEKHAERHVYATPGKYVLLAVSDTGCGMDQAVLEHIFEPFFTTKGVGEGTGLGLATVYGVVKQNGGFIDVCSEPGRGTTFRIYLPQHEAQVPREGTMEAAQPALGGTETILFVEDEPAILRLGQCLLEGLGYAVLAAGTPREAIRIAQAHPSPIHLLMTDVIMPEMNGRELADRIGTIRPTIDCLFLSGYTADAITHRGVLDSGVQFIQKPFSRTELAAKVRGVLERLDAGLPGVQQFRYPT